MQHKTAFGTIAAATAAAGLLLGAAPASAQTAVEFLPDCATGVLAYSPGLTAGAASDSTPLVGDTIVLSSGEGSFDPGSAVTATFDGVALSPAPTVSPTGNAFVSFTVPDVDAGTYIVIFRGTLNGSPNTVGVCFTVALPLEGEVEEPATQPTEAPAEEAPAEEAPAEEEPAPVVVVPISGDPAPAPATRPAALPFTGSVELITVAGLGAALVALGAGSVVVARRRRTEDVPAV